VSEAKSVRNVNQSVTTAVNSATSTRRRRLAIAVGLLFIMTLGYADRVNVSVAAPHIIDEFGLSKGQFGIVSSAFNWTYALLLIPVGTLADKVGTRLLLPLSIVVWSLGAGLTGASVGLVTLLAARLLMGAGESPVYPGGNLVVREWAPATERGFFTGMLNAGSLAGPAIGAVVAAYLVTSVGWRESFFILGGFGVVVGIVWFVVYDTPEKSKWLTPDERDHILATREVATSGADQVPMRLGSLLRTQTIWGLMVTQGCAVYTNYLFLSFLPLYLVDTRGLEDLGAGWVTGVTYGIAAVGSLGVAVLSDRALRGKDVRTGVRRRSVVTTLLMAAPLLALPWVSNIALIVVLISWVLVFVFSAITLNYALAGDLTVDKRSAGRVFALVTLGGNLFGLLAPIVTGYLVDGTGSYTLPFVVAVVLLGIGAVASARLSRRTLQPAASN